LPTSYFYTCSHIGNIITEGSKCEVGLGPYTKNVRNNFGEDRSRVFKKMKCDTNTPGAGRFLYLPFPYKEATYAENVSTAQKPLSLHYKTSLSIDIFALGAMKNNYHLRAKACLLMLCLVVHIFTTVV